MSTPTPPSRLTFYALLTAWANLLHQLSYPSWILGGEPLGWLLFLVSLAGAVRPSCFPVFVAVLVLRAAYTAAWIPMLRGHIFLEGVFTVGILLGLGFGLARLGKVRGFTREEEESLFESFAPFLRITCLVVYAAVTLSKLNVDFLDPEQSAAVQLLLWAARDHPFVPTSLFAREVSIWGTLAIEAGIPILLCFRRTRWLGLVTGLLFHALLGFLPLKIASFSLTMNLLLFAWLPAGSERVIHRRFCEFAARLRLSPTQLFLGASFVAGCTGMAYAARNGIGMQMAAVDLGLGMWWWQTAAMLAALIMIRHSEGRPATELLALRPRILWAYVGFLVLSPLSPYLGLKTRSALSMHCNLRTEQGHWNHLFLPEGMRVFGFQDDLVEVVDSDLPDFAHLRDEGMALPWFEFRRWCRLAEDDFFVEFRRRGGEPQRFEKAGGHGNLPELVQASPWLEWFLCFNPVGASHDYMPSLVRRVGPARNIVPKSKVPPVH